MKKQKSIHWCILHMQGIIVKMCYTCRVHVECIPHTERVPGEELIHDHAKLMNSGDGKGFKNQHYVI